MAVTEEEKVRARHHMGYSGMQAVQTFRVGVPGPIQTAFIIEGNLNNILPQSEMLFRKLLEQLDCIEAQIEENQGNLAVSGVDEIQIRADEFEQLVKRYKWRQGELANLLQCPPNPFDMRWGSWGGGGGINVTVSH